MRARRPEVVRIFVAPKRGAAMSSLTSVEALAGVGLAGDRYAEAKNRRSPDYEVTLIESENIEAFTRTTGRELTPEMPRRNIVTAGVRLNDLLGRRFSVGRAVFEGLELCEPCSLFAKRTYREVRVFFRGKGGLRARIVSGATLSIGDPVSPYLKADEGG
jgi:MOSC domain-containing protein YiiM